MTAQHSPLVMKVDRDRTVLLLKTSVDCGRCRRPAFVLVNRDGVTLCAHCSNQVAKAP